MIRRALVAAILILLAACSDGRASTSGVVIEVEGGIADVSGFLIRLPDGTDLRLRPVDGLLFDDTSSIGHIRDHLRSGEPVIVEYEVLDDGSAIAYYVSDE